jgi:hypothetical protein
MGKQEDACKAPILFLFHDSESRACFNFIMTNEKSAPSRDLDALANETLDLWQEHLASYAGDPAAKAELMRLLEPCRQLFAEWALLMQHGSHGASFFGKDGAAGGAGGAPHGTPSGATGRRGSSGPAGADAPRAASSRAASDGIAILLAQLSARVAGLEEKLARLESGTGGAPRAASSATRSRGKS